MTGPKVLEILTVPMDGNGLSAFALRFASRMARTRVDFLTFRADEASTERVKAMGAKLYLAPHRLRKPLSYLRFVARTVREGGYEVVHAHGNSCTLALDLLGARLGGAKVRIAHSHNTYAKYRALHRLLRIPFERLVTHRLACGEEAGRWLFGSKPFEVVPNAVDCGRYAFRDGGEAHPFTFGCVAGLTVQKNQLLLLKAFAGLDEKCPGCRLALAGEGPERGALEEQARRLGIEGRVDFLGWVDAAALLSRWDAMALPSLYEGFPTVALEWQCAGLPVLISDRVTRDCALTGDVRFLPLEAERWTEEMARVAEAYRGRSDEDRREASEEGCRAIQAAGYSLDGAAHKLEEKYWQWSGIT